MNEHPIVKYTYETSGVCSTSISITVRGNILLDCSFTGGCQGNLTAISRLVRYHPIDTLIEMLSGITCGNKSTSCPDQLASFLKEIDTK